ncbi:MAG: endonuclease V, partial [Planctomycetia bacterium]|nr:endonuclease V [Planctomycetia bacterium]
RPGRAAVMWNPVSPSLTLAGPISWVGRHALAALEYLGGLACHLGLWLGLPTLGCAKSRLIGEFEEPGPARGDRSPLVDKGETIGSVLRTRPKVKPVFVSAGHLCDLESGVAVVLASTSRYRMPEASRRAHAHVNELRRAGGPSAD